MLLSMCEHLTVNVFLGCRRRSRPDKDGSFWFGLLHHLNCIQDYSLKVARYLQRHKYLQILDAQRLGLPTTRRVLQQDATCMRSCMFSKANNNTVFPLLLPTPKLPLAEWTSQHGAG